MVLGSAVGAALFAVTALVVGCLCCINNNNNARRVQMQVVMGRPQMDDPDLGLALAGGGEGRRYSYEEVLNATDNFSKERLLGDEGSCSFYRGNNFANSGKPVAVKKLEMKSEEELWTDGYRARITALTKCRRRNMVWLMGWWLQRGQDNLSRLRVCGNWQPR